jgi:hypothetical protein
MRTHLLGLMIVAAVAPALADPYEQRGACDSDGLPAAHRVEITGGTA